MWRKNEVVHVTSMWPVNALRNVVVVINTDLKVFETERQLEERSVFFDGGCFRCLLYR